MNQEAATPVSVTVLDKEFRIACPPQERDALVRAARHLDSKMREIRHTGKVIGNDRVAVMAAINLTHELLELRDERDRLVAQMHSRPAAQETLLAHGESVVTQSVQHEADALHQQMQNLFKDCKPNQTY